MSNIDFVSFYWFLKFLSSTHIAIISWRLSIICQKNFIEKNSIFLLACFHIFFTLSGPSGLNGVTLMLFIDFTEGYFRFEEINWFSIHFILYVSFHFVEKYLPWKYISNYQMYDVFFFKLFICVSYFYKLFYPIFRLTESPIENNLFFSNRYFIWKQILSWCWKWKMEWFKKVLK